MDSWSVSSTSLASLLEDLEQSESFSDKKSYSDDDDTSDDGADDVIYVDTSKVGILTRSLKWGGLKPVSSFCWSDRPEKEWMNEFIRGWPVLT